VSGMGFDESLVRRAINKKFKMHGAGFDTAASLLDAVMEVQRYGDLNHGAIYLVPLSSAALQEIRSFSYK